MADAAATHRFGRPLSSVAAFQGLRELYHRRLTDRGRFVLMAALTVGFVGVDTRRALGFVLFALAAPPLVVGLVTLFRSRPAVRITGRLPFRLTAGRRLELPIDVRGLDARAPGPLSLFWGKPRRTEGLAVAPEEATLAVDPGGAARVSLSFDPRRRGRYELPSLGVARTDAFGLFRTRAQWLAGETVLVYPRYFTFGELPLPLGRRYQPGGIPLASEVGDSLEFVGTREYRPGDPLRKIHWRSWARRGEPVVMEHQEEYFSRLALVLDTFLPRRPRPRERERFEAAISVLASLTDHFSRSEEVVDVLAAGPDLYEVSTGRSLGYLDNVLDVLACLEPSSDQPFESIGPALLERLEGLTTVVAVMLEWDAAREAFLRKVRALGVSTQVVLVHDGATRASWSNTGDLGEILLIPPAEVERRLAAEEHA
jgi:uncharacterized protein (DUF58 family)